MVSSEENLELYRLMVGTITANEQRRQHISSVYIALLAAGFGAAGAVQNFSMVYVTAAAFVVSLVWYLQVKFLKRLATAKFHVIAQLEESLSFKPFAEEWKFLMNGDTPRKWAHLNLSDIEMVVPLSVVFVSAMHLIWSFWNAWGG